MNCLLLWIAAFGGPVESGWEPLVGGGHEYTLQIEPAALESLKRNQDIVAEIRPGVEVRAIRITVGSGKLARIDEPLPRRNWGETQAQLTAPPPREPDPPVSLPTWRIIEPEPIANLPPPPDDEPPRARARAAATAAPDESTMPTVRHAASERIYNTDKPALNEEVEKPWLPLAIAGLLLSLSLGANVYLGWIAWESRVRYRDAVARLRPSAA